MQLEDQQKVKSKISLTPLIDVVFLLLIFFMLTSTFSRFSSFNLLAKSGQSQETKSKTFILVRINGEGVIDVNGLEIPSEELVSTINTLALTPETKLIVKPVKGASVQHLVSVLEQAKKSKLPNPIVVR